MKAPCKNSPNIIYPYNILLFTNKIAFCYNFEMHFKSIPKIFPLLFIVIAFSALTAEAQKPTAKTFFDIGVEEAGKMEYSEAVDAFQHAIKLKPDYAEAYHKLGDAYYSLHRYEEAYDSYKKAVKANPKYVDAYISLGSLASMLGNDDEAVRALESAVRLKPKNADAQFTLGNLYSEAGKYEKAAEAYKRAVKVKPKFAEARYNLGIVYIKLSKQMLSEARKQYNRLRELDKELAKELDNMLRSKK
jgi:tetratricopeptide (TPR) repeat protein